MNKQSQLDFGKLREQLSAAGGKAMSGLGDVGTNLSSWWQSIPDEVKNTALRGTIGAGVGGLLAHTAAGGFADREYRPGVGPALLGALLGGGVAAGAPLGMKMLSGEIKFKPHEDKALVDTASDAIASGVATHPGLVAGAAGSGIAYNRMAPTEGGVLRRAARAARTDQNISKLRYPGPGKTIDVNHLRTLLRMGSPNLTQGPQLLRRIPNPRQWAATGATMAALPLLGSLIDRYAFGRHG